MFTTPLETPADPAVIEATPQQLADNLARALAAYLGRAIAGYLVTLLPQLGSAAALFKEPILPPGADQLRDVEAAALRVAPAQGEEPVSVKQLARLAGYRDTGHFREAVRVLIDRGLLVRVRGGLRRAPWNARADGNAPAAGHEVEPTPSAPPAAEPPAAEPPAEKTCADFRFGGSRNGHARK